MKQWTLKANTSKIEDLSFDEVSLPKTKANEVRIKVHAVSLNARDLMVIEQGFMRNPEIDLIPASDMSGIIDEIGTEVSEWSVGDHVVNLHFRGWVDGSIPLNAGGGLGSLDENGVLAEYIVLDSKRIEKAPKNWSHEDSSCLPCAGVTAWNALMVNNPIQSKDTVLVIGTGGVATNAAMIARGFGAKVVALVRNNDSNKELEKLGIATVINSNEVENWGAKIFEITGGVAKVINTIGFSAVNNSLEGCGYGGEVALIGLRDQEAPSLNYSIFGKSIRGIAVGSGKMYRDLKEHLEATGEKPIIAEQFNLLDVKKGLNSLKKSGIVGKIVIKIV